MRMFCTNINAELTEHLSTETILRKHALNSMFKNACREAFEHLTSRRKRRAALIAGMAEVGLIRQLFSCKLNFFRINNNDKITRINMRCIRRLIFTAKDLGNLYCETANRLTFSVYNIPFAFDIGCVRYESRLDAYQFLLGKFANYQAGKGFHDLPDELLGERYY